jgi:Cut8, nuclear proteasome tether protein
MSATVLVKSKTAPAATTAKKGTAAAAAAARKRKAEDAPPAAQPSEEKRAKLGSLAAAVSRDGLQDELLKFFKKHEDLVDEFSSALAERACSVEDMKPEFAQLLNDINRAFPHTRWGSSTDKYSYGRVSPSISKLRQRLYAQGTKLVDAGSFKALLMFSQFALDEVIAELPNWDEQKHNDTTSGNMTKKVAVWVAKAVRGMDSGTFNDPEVQKILNDEYHKTFCEWGKETKWAKGVFAALKKQKFVEPPEPAKATPARFGGHVLGGM